MDIWRRTFFIEPVVILSFTLCLIIGLFYHYKNKERLFFTAYFSSGVILFMQTPIVIAGKILTGRQLTIYHEISNTAFELTEFLAFYFFFKKCLQNRNHQKYLKISLYLFVTSIVIFFIGLTFPSYEIEDIILHSLFINVVEFFFLFIMCLAYFSELFTAVPTKNLSNRPSFLIATSTFFYTILMIPFFLIAHDIFLSEKAIYNILFACHYFLIIMVLFSVSRAFLYKIPITT
jgi:hypothetical protein